MTYYTATVNVPGSDPNLTGTVRIILQADFGDDTYELRSVDGTGHEYAVATSKSPKKLSDYAFSRGAERVRHDYDLRRAEVY